MSMSPKKDTFSIGLMLFALFFGAGNMIFPPALGQAAGTSVWVAMAGFVITGVGLPLLGVLAIAVTGGNLQTIANRVHPLFGVLFTGGIFLVIGPLFGIPRTASVAFEMGAAPFLPAGWREMSWPLLAYTAIFFTITFWLCLNPTKLVDRIGKILTPVLLGIILLLLIQSMIHPIGEFGVPAESYQSAPFFKGFLEGYLTMDTLGALVFGIVAVTAVKDRGVTDRKALIRTMMTAGCIAGFGLALVYLILGYLGATSQTLGLSENGGQILTAVVTRLFGMTGTLLLGVGVTLACLTTSVGLVTATSMYFSRAVPHLSYKKLVAALCIAGMAVANLGLNNIISVSVPVLVALYPLAIVLILLTFAHRWFEGRSSVYVGALVCTALISVVDGLKWMEVSMGWLDVLYSRLPLYQEGIGWILPAAIGALLGYAWSRVRQPSALYYREKSTG